MVYKFLKKESNSLLSFFSSSIFIYLTLIGNITLFSLTFLVYQFEHQTNPHINNYWDAFWWGITTITTVGYGDVVPVTLPGKITALLLMLIGTVLFISVTGILVSFLLSAKTEKKIKPIEKEIKQEEKTQQEILKILKKIETRLDKLEKKPN